MQPYQRFTVPIVEDSDGQLCLEFPDEVLDALDLKIGDVLNWEPTINGAWHLKKVEDGRDNDTE